MNILYASDDNYAWLAGISLLSLLKNNSGKHSIYIMDDGISGENKEKLSEIVGQFDSDINFIDVRSNIEKLINNGTSGYGATDNMNMTVYARLFAADLLPDTIDSVLYLDCDTLVRLSLDELKCENAMMMWPDCLRNEYKKVINIPLERVYYNSGVVVMNLKKWRECNCTKIFFDHIRNIRADYPLVDQDIINVALYDYIDGGQISGYNCLSQMLLYKYNDYKYIYGLEESNWMSKKLFEETIEDPKIVHFCGNTYIRPWFKNSHHPFKDEWYRYFWESPWNGKELVKCKFKPPYAVQYFSNKFFLPSIDVFLAGLMQRIFIYITYNKDIKHNRTYNKL